MFDIEDFTDIPEKTDIEKQKVDKHSKIYARILSFMKNDMERICAMAAKKAEYVKPDGHKDGVNRPPIYVQKLRCALEDDYEFLNYLLTSRDEFDDDVRALLDSDEMKEFFGKIEPVMKMMRFAHHILDPYNHGCATHDIHPLDPLTEDDKAFVNDELSEIKSEEHPLCRWLVLDQKEDIQNIYRFLPDDANLNWIDTSRIVDLSYTFANSSFNGDISLWKFDKAETFNMMFAFSPFNGDISKWEFPNVWNMDGMFQHSAFNGDISQWKLLSVISMRRTFAGTKFDQDISQWTMETPSIQMFDIFEQCPIRDEFRPEFAKQKGAIAFRETNVETGEKSMIYWEEHVITADPTYLVNATPGSIIKGTP